MTYHPLPNRGEFFTQGDDCRSTFGEDAMRQIIVFQKFQLRDGETYRHAEEGC